MLFLAVSKLIKAAEPIHWQGHDGAGRAAGGSDSSCLEQGSLLSCRAQLHTGGVVRAGPSVSVVLILSPAAV